MTIATRPSPTQTKIVNGDIRTIQRGRTWAQFKHLQQGFENARGIKLAYYDGTIEILMPGKPHELFKSVIGMLVETFLLDRELEFEPTGSMTQEQEGIAAAEADESYQIGAFKLSIEVNFTSGDISKLDYYQALGVEFSKKEGEKPAARASHPLFRRCPVHEVWLWEDAVLAVYHLRSEGYEQVNRSQIPELAAIDLAVLSTCIRMGETSRVEAVKRFRAAHPLAL